jgi:hypothetical protein
MARDNLGVCSKCRAFVPVEHVSRDGKVYLRKSCPDCGPTEALVSTDDRAWRRKRNLWQYTQAEATPCDLRCTQCGHDHRPSMVFVDVTNRCNMNCPICIANIPAMGFRFEPPMEYFEKLFAGLAGLAPEARINLFGGEPTVRDDLFDIIHVARANGFRPRIVTNGLRLADEAYCKEVVEAGVPVLFALDGLSAGVYARLRKNPGAFQTKMRALENLKKSGARRNTIMTCVARKINEHEMGDLIRFCHANRDFIRCMHMIPLTETWEEGEFETDVATTTEDVERIIAAAVPEGPVEFWPAGLPARWGQALRFVGSPKLTFGGVHPNCEASTLLLSDGEQYRGIGYYTRRPVSQVAATVTDLSLRLAPLLSRLDLNRPLQRAWGTVLVLLRLGPPVVRFLNWRRIMKGNPVAAVVRILAGLAAGRELKDVLRANARIQDAMLMIILPFEEYHSVESERLRHCKTAFAYVDPDTEEVRLVPTCTWPLYRSAIQRKIADKYAAAEHSGRPAARSIA